MKRRVLFILSLIVWLLSGVPMGPPDATAASLRDEMIAKAKKEKPLVIGGGASDAFRDHLVNLRKQYPFITVKPFVANTATTVNRVVAEAQVGKTSIDMVVFSSGALELLAAAKLLQKMEYPHLKDFRAGTQPGHGYFVNAFLNPRTQGLYNTDLVPPSEVPRSWEDMLDPKWKGRTLISRSAEEFPALLAFIWGKDGKLNWERSFDFFRKLEKHKPFIGRGMRGGTSRVAAGEVDIFWFPAFGPGARLYFRGAPVGVIAFPKFPAPSRSAGIIKGARSPASAWLTIDYLTSPQGQFDYSDLVSAVLPLNKKAKAGKLANWVISQGGTADNAVPLPADIVFNKEVAKKSENFFFKLLGIK